MKQGNITVHSENIIPIIKKWLYSDKEIFLRELISNACDAITKFKKLCSAGVADTAGAAESSDDKFRIDVKIDKKNSTLSVIDNGIGMTSDEVEKYITQIAFSGAEDFLKKYEKAGKEGIIGHFGLGFYSAYMVADEIEINTLSYEKGAEAVYFNSDGNETYEIGAGKKEARGTEVILKVAKGEKEFLDENRIKALLKKYCAFMPYEIYLNAKDGKAEPVNNPSPLYLKDPKDCAAEDYNNFYKDTFNDFENPLFYIHLKVDYPVNLKGILFFPKQKNVMDINQGEVKLYANRVYVADNIKEVIPEFLMLLKGVIDCPDIPLNVSRSFLQNDREVQKISKHIIKKTADKLNGLYKTERESYDKYWNDIMPFFKFGCIKEADFYDKVKDIIIFEDLDKKFVNLNDLVKENEDVKIYYYTDENKQAQYINMFKENNITAYKLSHYIDSHFISFLEIKNQKVKFLRIDSATEDALKEEGAAENASEIEALFKENLDNKTVIIKAEKLKNKDLPAVINVTEFSRRFKEMSRLYGNIMADGLDMDKDLTLIVNAGNALIGGLKDKPAEVQKLICNQVFDLALLSYKDFSSAELDAFLKRSGEILKRI